MKNTFSLILHSLFDFLYDYGKEDLIFALYRDQNQYPKLISHYITWLDKYAYIENYPRKKKYTNKIVLWFCPWFSSFRKKYFRLLAGMSDVFLIQVFNELITF